MKVLFLSLVAALLAWAPRVSGAVVVEASALATRDIVLDSGWQYSPGDEPDGVPPGPEADWRPLTGTAHTAGQTPPAWTGMGWFRLDFDVSADMASKPLALRLWHPGASEVFVDGQKVAAFGTVGAAAAFEQPYDPQGIPTMVALSAGRHSLHLRYSCAAVTDPLFGRWLIGRRGAGFRAALDLPSRSLEEMAEERTAYLGLNIGIAALALGFAVFHLLLFLLHPRQRGNLWFALFAVALSANGILESLLKWAHFGLWGSSLMVWANTAVAGLIMLGAVGFLASLRSRDSKEARRLSYAWAGLFLADLVPAWRPAIPALGSVLILISGLVGLWLLVGAWRDRLDIRSLGFSALGWSVIAVSEVAKQSGWLSTWPEVGAFALGVLLMLLGASLFLARRVAAEGRELEVLARGLEERVAERTAELRRSESDAQSANRAKSHFLATMSHEIRTPMNAIVGLSELMARGDLAQEPKAKAELLHRSARSLLILLDEVLDISRIEAGQLELQNRAYELEDVVRDAVELFATQATQAGLDLGWRIDREVPRILLGDRARLRQVLVNLIGNALKFTERGEVEVEVWQREEDELLIEVRDTGLGIPPEASGRLFEPFFQIDSSATRRHGGAGLGLAICQQLVSAMGGTIGLESRPGEGTTFRVTLPLIAAPVYKMREDARESRMQAVGDPATARQLRILHAEDNEVNQIVTKLMLEELGHRADTVGDGQGALEALGREAYDVALLDLHMPDITGVDVARQARERGYGLYLVALTASVSDEDRELCRSAGMNEFLAKPVSLEELQQTLARVGRAGARDQESGQAKASVSTIASAERPRGL